jgi:AcrR family transcriptional regulator
VIVAASISPFASVFGADSTSDPAILDGAMSAFLDFGIRRASMNEIAKRAHISPATLYRRFANKTALVEAVVLREAREFVVAVDNRVDRAASAREQVVEGFVAFTVMLAGNRLLRRLLITEPETILPQLTIGAAPTLALGRAYLAETLRRLQEEEGLPRFDVDGVAEICARLALSLALTPDGIIPIDDEAAARKFADEHITALVRLPSTAK